MPLPITWSPFYAVWRNKPNRSTPVTAEAATNWDDGIQAAITLANLALDTASLSNLTVINHGSDPTVARPESAAVVLWIGSVYPDNFLDGDLYLATALVEPTVSWLAAYRASSLIGADGAAIALWGDTSGNGHDLVQASSGLKPTVHRPGGTVPTSAFFNNAQALQSAFGTTISQPTTVIIALNCVIPTTTGSVMEVFDGANSSHRNVLFARANSGGTGGIFRAFAGGSNLDSDTVDDPSAQWRIVSVIFNGAASLMRVNGQQVAVGTDLGSEGLTGLTLGAIFAETTPNFLTGYITEVRVAAGALDVNTISQVEEYMAFLVGITLTAG